MLPHLCPTGETQIGSGLPIPNKSLWRRWGSTNCWEPYAPGIEWMLRRGRRECHTQPCPPQMHSHESSQCSREVNAITIYVSQMGKWDNERLSGLPRWHGWKRRTLHNYIALPSSILWYMINHNSLVNHMVLLPLKPCGQGQQVATSRPL